MKRILQRFFLVYAALTLCSSAFAQSKINTLTAKQIAEGWILLWDGETTFGWEAHGKAEWMMRDGILMASSGENGWLGTTTPFGDFLLKASFRTAADGNSGIFLRCDREGEPHKTGYELQIFDKHKEFKTGSLVNYLKAKPVKTTANVWHTFEVLASGTHFVIKLDGKKLLDGNDSTHKVGYIGLQYNKGKTIEFRNLLLKPLGMASLFDGRDLKGWQKVNSPDKSKGLAEWSIKKRAIHVERGPGQLETETTYQDFVLQLDVRTNALNANHHPNSGVFLRGDPGGFWTGYESQIRNEYSNGDRTKPVDFGTGGIYHYQPTRRVIPNDGEFFTKTIVVDGRHLSVWINGLQVSDFTDVRAEGTNARKEARLKPGTISLQAHDPTTNLEFRNLRVVSLAKR